jgi:uncharacterized protein (TIGR02246 family)
MRLQIVVLGLLVGLSCLFPVSSLVAGDPDTSKDGEAIRKVIAAGLAAANDHDPKAAAKIFHKDGTLTTPIGEVLRGPEAIEKLYALLYQEYDPKRGMPSLKKAVVKHDKVSIRFLRPDVALADITFISSGAIGPDGKDTGTTKGLVSYVFTREQGIWAVADKHVMDLPAIPDRPGDGPKK